MGARRSFFDHLHPGRVRLRTLKPTTTWGLGVACVTCMVVLGLTGLSLLPYYQASEQTAYERIVHISTALRYGGLIRDLHFFAANALVVLSWLHLARVFLTGGYRGRRLNWLYGLGLLLVVLVANYTGYLLPWDQTAYWAARVGSQLLGSIPVAGPTARTLLVGGRDIGPDTLPRAFALHVGVVPLALGLLGSLHLWRVRKDGGLASPARGGETLPASPWLYRAEAAVALTSLGVLLLLAMTGRAPLSARADPFHPPNPAKAPWYFVGVQEMVSHSATLGGVVAPILLALFLVLAPFLDRSHSPGGVWFERDRRALHWTFLLALLVQAGFIVVGQWMRGENWAFRVPF
ncbi:MAG: hypothetical protein Kow0092_06730 [Deferrisomatales bacterium]